MGLAGHARFSPELILRLQTTVGNHAVQRLLERRIRIEEPEFVQPARRRWQIWWIGGTTALGTVAGVCVWFWFRDQTLAIALPFAAAVIALTVVAWVRSGKL
jgi:hypothetical protein